jgi:hypothetical protein
MMQHYLHLLLGYMDGVSKWERHGRGGEEENSGVEGTVLA